VSGPGEGSGSGDGRTGTPATPGRRQFTVEYKQSILQELDQCDERGDRTAVLEREGLLWSSVAKWRRQREAGMLEDSWVDLSPRARLLQLLQERDALLEEIDRLRDQNTALRREAGAALFPRRLREALGRLLGGSVATPGRSDEGDD